MTVSLRDKMIVTCTLDFFIYSIYLEAAPSSRSRGPSPHILSYRLWQREFLCHLSRGDEKGNLQSTTLWPSISLRGIYIYI